MFAALRSRLTFSNVVAMLALVFAMSGGAYAVSSRNDGSSIGRSTRANASSRGVLARKRSKGKSSPVGKPGPRGPAGPTGPVGSVGATGPTGAVGPAGSAGLKGENGKTGENGKNGEAGEPGAPGENVTSKNFTGKAGGCEEGGSEFKVGSAITYACNGEKGVIHPGETLAPGATETGVWYFRTAVQGEEAAQVPISFPIPLANPIESSEVCKEGKPECPIHFVPNEEGSTPPGCFEGSTEGTIKEPKAAPGNLCIYEGGRLVGAEPEERMKLFRDVEQEFLDAIGTAGGLVAFDVTGAEGSGHGAWAMTAPK